ncbi:hypothetical protein C0991_009061 [Blastosporella zonata]|nr:hypothetical protein C0991_009061 [Blastosporella zonata]
MAKTNRTSRPSGSNGRPGKPRPSNSKANAAGYAKRHSKKAKTLNGLGADVYEYAPEATRRSKVALDLDHDEAAEYGVGLDGDNEAREELRARLIGENGDDEMIDSEDDEEIDSDAAFEESDEERFAGFFSAKDKKKVRTKKQPSVKFAEVDLNEDEDVEEGEEAEGPSGDEEDDEEEEEEEGDPDEFIDVLDMLDGRGEMDNADDGAAPAKSSERSGITRSRPSDMDEDEDEGGAGDDASAMDEDESADDDSEAEEKMEFSPSDSEDAEPEALDELQNLISTLDPTAKKRKAIDGDAPILGTERTRKQRRLNLKERTEAGAENEFRAQSSGSKLNLDDLLAPLASQSSTLQSLKQSTKALGSSSSKVKTLSAPLPQRAQERLDREAAYEETKGEVDKWSATMKRIREAEHLSFPLQAPTAERVSNLTLAAKFKPTTALESSVDALLRSAKLREEDIQQTEETMLKMNKLSVEEVEQRRGELRKMRELMFRAEIKARRIGKIKSKTYRKIKRKERERLGEKMEDGEGSEGEEERLKREVERARERATLRHKHTGKWAKKMRTREGEEGRQEIEDMLARGEKLRRRIKGVASDDESDEDTDDDKEGFGDDAEDNIGKIKRGAFDELRRVEMEDGSLQIEGGGKGKSKSIFEMKFMKDAMARQQHSADKMADDFIKEMGGQLDVAEDSDVEDAPEVDLSSGVVAQRTGGRISYHPGAPTNKTTRPIGSLASDTSSVTLKSTDLLSPPQSPLDLQRPNVPLPPTSDSNPWLAPRDSEPTSIKAPKKNNEVVVGKDSTVMTKSKNKLKKLARKRGDEKAKAVDDAVVEISVDKVLTLKSAPAAAQSSTVSAPPPKKASATLPKATAPSTSSVAARQEDASDDDDVHSEIEEQEKILDLKGKGKAKLPQAFEQRDLVALAFAGDNVVHEFQEAKKREIAADAPREVDTTIPGWGSWGGAGVRAAPPKAQRIKKIAGIDPTTRADYGKAHVIISEKRDKKAAKYLVKDLPYPYTSKAQFEKAMERPLGTEWNTRVAFQRGTLPKVVKKVWLMLLIEYRMITDAFCGAAWYDY